MEQSDHDLLIKLDTNVHTFCKKMEKMHTENREDHREIFKLLETHKNENNDKLDKKIDKRLYTWITGILIFLMISLSIYVTDIDVATEKCFNKMDSQIQIYHPDKPTPLHKVPEQ